MADCNLCDAGCQGAQHYCSTVISQFPSDFGFLPAGAPEGIKPNDIIINTITLTKFNELIRWLNSVASYYQNKTGEPSVARTISEQDTKFISASKTNEIIDFIGEINPDCKPNVRAKAGDIISASFFNEVFGRINGLTFSNSKCPRCITEDCDSCNSCEICNWCDTCQSCDVCESEQTEPES